MSEKVEPVILPLKNGAAQIVIYDEDEDRWHILDAVYHYDGSGANSADNDGPIISPQADEKWVKP